MNKITGTILSLLLAGSVVAVAEDGVSETAETQPTAATEKQQTPSKKKPKSNLRDNLFFGGYINLSFGDYSVIGIEPMVGYKFNPKFSAGVKVRYDYINDDRYGQDRSTSNYGGSIFGRYNITPKFYAQLEPAAYSSERLTGGSWEREWVPYVFAGGGLRQPLGGRSWLFVEIMFDVLQDEKSPYDDWTPFFSIGAGTGF